MGMAEKDDTEGRCPACRTPYDKEKIVGAAKCERLIWKPIILYASDRLQYQLLIYIHPPQIGG